MTITSDVPVLGADKNNCTQFGTFEITVGSFTNSPRYLIGLGQVDKFGQVVPVASVSPSNIKSPKSST